MRMAAALRALPYHVELVVVTPGQRQRCDVAARQRREGPHRRYLPSCMAAGQRHSIQLLRHSGKVYTQNRTLHTNRLPGLHQHAHARVFAPDFHRRKPLKQMKAQNFYES